MNGSRFAVVIAVAFASLGPLVARAQTSGAPPVVPVDARSTRTYNGFSEDHILTEIRTARILGRTQVGSTSVNFHFHLQSDVDCAFKPRTVANFDTYRSEIAAFRLNRMLGLNRVPPAISRYVSVARLALTPDVAVVPESGGSLRGAAIYWVPVMHDSRIDRQNEQTRWAEWLHQGNAIPPEESGRAEEISTLVVFDTLTGNWDRWSGQNVPMDAAGHLIYRDNNGAFGEPFGDRMMTGVMRYLRMVQKFSRGFVDRARAITAESVRAEMALDPDTAHPPLSATQIQSLLRRRDTVTAYIDDLVQRYGETNVYAWP